MPDCVCTKFSLPKVRACVDSRRDFSTMDWQRECVKCKNASQRNFPPTHPVAPFPEECEITRGLGRC